MNSKIINILSSFLVVLVLGLQQVKAQKVVTQNNDVEFLENDNGVDDLNNIKIPRKKIKVNKVAVKKTNKKNKSIAKVEKLVNRKKYLRFRSKRKNGLRGKDKCHKEEVCKK